MAVTAAHRDDEAIAYAHLAAVIRPAAGRRRDRKPDPVLVKARAARVERPGQPEQALASVVQLFDHANPDQFADLCLRMPDRVWLRPGTQDRPDCGWRSRGWADGLGGPLPATAAGWDDVVY